MRTRCALTASGRVPTSPVIQSERGDRIMSTASKNTAEKRLSMSAKEWTARRSLACAYSLFDHLDGGQGSQFPQLIRLAVGCPERGFDRSVFDQLHVRKFHQQGGGGTIGFDEA